MSFLLILVPKKCDFSGLIIKVCNASSVEIPIKAYIKENEFKLYLFDVGLLCAMVDIDNASILLDGDYSFKGAIPENYVVEQLKSIKGTSNNYVVSVGSLKGALIISLFAK